MSGSEYSEEEIARRRDEAIRRALNTPPKPLKKASGRKTAKAKPKSRVRKSAQAKPKSA
jgi:hypothetical protein